MLRRRYFAADAMLMPITLILLRALRDTYDAAIYVLLLRHATLRHAPPATRAPRAMVLPAFMLMFDAFIVLPACLYAKLTSQLHDTGDGV